MTHSVSSLEISLINKLFIFGGYLNTKLTFKMNIKIVSETHLHIMT
jgi:hypothetical protein